MQALVYFLVIPFIYLLAVLPFPVLYLFSDFMCFVIYSVIGYRKKVVLQNLKNSFPEKTEKELQQICTCYYHYLCDLFLETFKTLTISKKRMLKRCRMTDEATALFTRFANEGKNIIFVMGHLGNWEWGGNTFSLVCKHQLFVIYHPIANKYFNKLIYGMRSRFGTKLIAMNNTYKDMLCNKTGLNAFAFIADQTPQPQNAFWLNFLNQDTPVFKGTEVIAKKFNYPVVYVAVYKIKRGYYEVRAEVISENPKDTELCELTKTHTSLLEQDIIASPATWLWSHRRWKHKRTIS